MRSMLALFSGGAMGQEEQDPRFQPHNLCICTSRSANLPYQDLSPFLFL